MSGKSRLGGAVIGATLALLAQGQTIEEALVPVDHPAIRYNDAPVSDRVSRVIQDMKSGKTQITSRNDGTGALTSLLQALDVNADSQMLVFSKTSFQASRISTRNPRA